MNKTSINQRFATSVNSIKNTTKSEIAKKLGLKNSTFSEIMKGRMNVGTDHIARFCSVFRISELWLLTGQGSMLKKEEDLTVAKLSSSNEGIPLIPISAMAGFGGGDCQILKNEVDLYIVPHFKDLQIDFMINVRGSSMQPKYNSGDVVACKKLPLDTFFQWNKVYVLDTTQGPLVKRIKKSQEKNCIQCISDNKTYDPFDLPLSEIRSLAIVLGVIRIE